MIETELGTAELLRKLSHTYNDSGRGITWHIVNGGDIYKKIFVTCVQLMKKSDADLIIEKSRFTRLTGAPSSALAYPLFKYSQEEFLVIKNNKIFIYGFHRENWSDLCRTLQTTI
jgi:hypothetical protein